MAENKNNILFITGSHYLAGSEIANINVARALVELGHQVYYLVTPWAMDEVGSYIKQFNIPIIPFRYYSRVYSIKYFIQSLIYIWIDYFNLNKAIQEKNIDILHISSEHYARIFILTFLFKSNLKVIYRMGDAPNVHRNFHRWLWKRIIIKRTDRFVCVSKFIYKKLISLGCPKEKVSIIYSYPLDRNKSNTCNDANDLNKNSTNVVFLGQISRHKGVDLLVEAAIQVCESTDEVQFLIVGNYNQNPQFYEHLKRSIEQHELSNKIIFTGYKKDINELLFHSDIHVCPSVFEDPMPNVVFEAKQAGLPSVVFKSGGIPELIEHRSNGFICDEKSAEALKEGILYYLDKEKRIMHGQNAKYSLKQLGMTEENFKSEWSKAYEF